MALQFQVDEDVCVGCGECANVCPFQLIEMKGDIPAISESNELSCVQCQHCFAVCSTGALSILGLDPSDSITINGSSVEPLQLSTLMKGRRSVRLYKKEPVARQDLDLLLETISYAPTGVNNRQVHFTMIDNPEVMERLRERTYEKLNTIHSTNAYPPGMDYFKQYIADAIENNRDTIFRGAPHMLIASSPKTSPSPEVDCHIALTYFELLAASMGLGTVWCGLGKGVLTMLIPELLRELGIPETHLVGYVMMFGKPDVTYHRTVQRSSMSVNRVQKIG
ncbi:nitroreductase family protein [Desulfopila aestuarii]|uniref:Nitroreductase n=1 Tax=Desulfopila aestuarii DSM 18488 TaxID=1121416 RepID=A0A1M7YJ31_9BACT|nr:nitroreductase family protein [Desulfopila aestuarii]SHO52644.1 Nitroreductase [Desulfopila aestuarii DSM 18488]